MPAMSGQQHLATRIDGALQAISGLQAQLPQLHAACEAVVAALAAGRTVYTAGNGGSAAQAMHLAEELIGRYRSNRPAQRGICINADATALTCIANDFGYEQVFARQCEALLTQGDVLVVLSTSGRSANIVNALQVARQRGAMTIGLLGKDGGGCRELCDHCLIVAADDSAHIQEAHQVIVHLICEAVELAI